MPPPLIHICPTSVGGVSDYVDICIQHQPGAIKLSLNKQTAASVSLSGDVILHFSGYGYQKRGVPLWLLKKIEAERPKIKTLGVLFHELYAFGPPWGSAFWLSPAQRYITRRIAELSDFWITSREGYATWLRRFASDKANAVLPICSTVGEILTYSQERYPKLVVFGGPALREETYRAAGQKLFEWAHTQGLEVHDIGPTIKRQDINNALKQAGVVVHGRLEAKDVSQLLSNSSFGLVKYPVEYVAKSSVFAAYAAHGVCPVLISPNDSSSSELIAFKHYIPNIPCDNFPINLAEKTGNAAWEWYQTHGVYSHVAAQLNLVDAKQ